MKTWCIKNDPFVNSKRPSWRRLEHFSYIFVATFMLTKQNLFFVHLGCEFGRVSRHAAQSQTVKLFLDTSVLLAASRSGRGALSFLVTEAVAQG